MTATLPKPTKAQVLAVERSRDMWQKIALMELNGGTAQNYIDAMEEVRVNDAWLATYARG